MPAIERASELRDESHVRRVTLESVAGCPRRPIRLVCHMLCPCVVYDALIGARCGRLSSRHIACGILHDEVASLIGDTPSGQVSAHTLCVRLLLGQFLILLRLLESHLESLRRLRVGIVVVFIALLRPFQTGPACLVSRGAGRSRRVTLVCRRWRMGGLRLRLRT